MIVAMADLLLRNVPPKTLDALRARALARNRIVEAEALEVLERGIDTTVGATLLSWAKTNCDPNIDTSDVAVGPKRGSPDGYA